MLGFGNSLAYGSLRNEVLMLATLDMDLRAGYEIIPDLRGYALGTGVLQTVDNDLQMVLDMVQQLNIELLQIWHSKVVIKQQIWRFRVWLWLRYFKYSFEVQLLKVFLIC